MQFNESEVRVTYRSRCAGRRAREYTKEVWRIMRKLKFSKELTSLYVDSDTSSGMLYGIDRAYVPFENVHEVEFESLEFTYGEK